MATEFTTLKFQDDPTLQITVVTNESVDGTNYTPGKIDIQEDGVMLEVGETVKALVFVPWSSVRYIHQYGVTPQ